MERFFRAFLSDPFFTITLLYNLIQILWLRCRGYKTIVYNMHHDYFFDIFVAIYEQLLIKKNIAVYFSFRRDTPELKSYLTKRVPKNRLIPNHVSPFIPFHLFLCAEINGPDFPLPIFKTRTVEMYHGISTFELYTKKLEVMRRFDVHFAIGPHFNRFFETCFKIHQKKVYNVGFPKTDAILAKNNDRKLLTKEFSLNNKKVILYAPHWNPHGSLHAFEDNILKVLVRQQAVVIVKAHNYLFHKFQKKQWYARLTSMAAKYDNLIFYNRADTKKLFAVANMDVTIIIKKLIQK